MKRFTVLVEDAIGDRIEADAADICAKAPAVLRQIIYRHYNGGSVTPISDSREKVSPDASSHESHPSSKPHGKATKSNRVDAA